MARIKHHQPLHDMQLTNRQAQRTLCGVGLGLRACHHQYILTHNPAVPWFEVVTENYLAEGGASLDYLSQISERYPLVLHGVGMSLGSYDPLNRVYLNRLKQLITQFNPVYVSDHLCWTSYQGQYFHELLPLPYTEKMVIYVADRIKQVQDFLGRRILIENVSSYLSFQTSQMPEWAFINAILAQADCDLLLDVNNVYVNATNHGFAADEYIRNIAGARVKQMHLAGFQDCGTHLLDAHGAAVHDSVWDLYKLTVQRLGAVPTCIERDHDIPEFAELWREAELAQQYMQSYAKQDITTPASAHSIASTLAHGVASASADRIVPTVLRTAACPRYPVKLEESTSSENDFQKNMAQVLNDQKSTWDKITIRAPLNSEQRLAIYRHSFTAALQKVLAETYTVCRQLVGDAFFNAMTQRYITQTASRHPDIDEYGASLSTFIRNFPAAKTVPYLADCADLEWALHQADRAAATKPFNAQALAEVAEANYPNLIFKLPPGSALLSSNYPIDKIWQWHQPGYSGEATVDLDAGGVKLFIWRTDLQTRMEVLDEASWLLLTALRDALPLGIICDRFSENHPAIDVPILLAEFVRREWLFI